MSAHALLPRTEIPIVPASIYIRGYDWLAAMGMDPQALLREAGIDPAVLRAPNGLLTLDQVERFVTAGVRRVNQPGLILHFADKLLFASLGEIGFAIMTAADLGAAFDVAERFIDLLNPLCSLVHERKADFDEVRLDLRYRMDPEFVRVVVHVTLGSTVGLAHHGTGQSLSGAELILPPGERIREPVLLNWLEQQGLRLAERPGVWTLRIPSALARARLIMADARAHRGFVARCEELLSEQRVGDPTIREVRRRLRESGPPFLDLDALSSRMGTSARTLRRRLSEEGASFRDLLDEARFSWAADALIRSDRSVSDIAYEIGYSAPEGFTRAFGRAVGLSPTAYRHQ